MGPLGPWVIRQVGTGPCVPFVIYEGSRRQGRALLLCEPRVAESPQAPSPRGRASILLLRGEKGGARKGRKAQVLLAIVISCQHRPFTAVRSLVIGGSAGGLAVPLHDGSKRPRQWFIGELPHRKLEPTRGFLGSCCQPGRGVLVQTSPEIRLLLIRARAIHPRLPDARVPP